MDTTNLRLVTSAKPSLSTAPPDPGLYQAMCIEAYQSSQAARGFSQLTIDNGTATLERFLTACGRPAWEVTRDDIDRVVGELATVGMATSTRRGYLSTFKGFFTFLCARKVVEIEAMFGMRLADPVDEFNAARHVGTDSPHVLPPPTPQRLDTFFAFLRERIATARSIRHGRPRLRLVPHALPCRVAIGGGGDARCRRPLLRPGTVRQDSCAVR